MEWGGKAQAAGHTAGWVLEGQDDARWGGKETLQKECPRPAPDRSLHPPHTHTLAGTAWMSTRLMPAPLGGGAVDRPQARTQHGFPQPTGSGSGGSGRPLATHNPEPACHQQHDEDEDDDACLAAGTEATATTLACKA